MLATLRVPAIILIGSVTLAGCAGSDLFGGSPSSVTTSSVVPAAAKMDPACPSLSAQIDNLRKEGVAEKIEKASAKKYKMTPGDMTKADQLTKVNAEFQSKCSTLPRSAAAPATPAAPAMAAAVAPAVAQAVAPKVAAAAPAAAITGAAKAKAAAAASAIAPSGVAPVAAAAAAAAQ